VEHVVFFPAADTTPAFRRVASLEDAVRLVEHLRNVDGVSEVSVHMLAEVPLTFRTVIQVEVPGAPEPAAPAAPVAQQAAAGPTGAAAQPAPVLAAVVPLQAEPAAAQVPDGSPADPDRHEQDESAGAGRRSLGFFA